MAFLVISETSFLLYCFKLGGPSVLRNADDGGGCQLFRKKALRRWKIQRYYRYEGVSGGPISRKKALRNTNGPLKQTMFCR